jgi:hypothetical protein
MSTATTNGDRRSTFGTLTYVLIGPIIWAAHFSAIYAVQSVGCAIAGADMAVQRDFVILTVVWVATGAAITVLSAALVAPRGSGRMLGAGSWPAPQPASYRRIMTILAVLSVFGIAAAAGVTLFLPVCTVLA